MSIAAALAELERSPELHDHIAYLEALVADEQLRRKKFIDDLNKDAKAEFIYGHVVLHPPVQHAEFEVSLFVASLLTEFATQEDSGAVYRKNCLVRCQRNDYMPDVCFFTDAKADTFDDESKLFPPPDLIVEVLSPWSESNDRKLKLQDYARHEVGEYWIVDPDNQMVEQYILSPSGAEFRLKARLAKGGKLTSVVIVGFDVPVSALFDVQENRRARERMLKSN